MHLSMNNHELEGRTEKGKSYVTFEDAASARIYLGAARGVSYYYYTGGFAVEDFCKASMHFRRE